MLARLLGLLVALVIVAILAVALFGPRPQVAMGQAPVLPDIGALDGWLADREAVFDDLKPGAAKRIVWAGGEGLRTPLSIVYVHGFSATSEEIRPIPDRLAESFGANLHFTRLAGHGRDMDTGGAALAEPEAADWMSDLREAAAIGAAIGERTVIVTLSTGGTLAALAAAEGLMPPEVAGIAFLSPNFRIQNPLAAMLTWPGAEWWLPVIGGETRSFEPENPAHAEWWTTRYPSAAAFPLGAVVEAAREADYAGVPIPAYVAFSPFDQVVDHAASRAVAARWGGPVTLEELSLAPGSDPANHIVGGDILSPAMNDEIIGRLEGWIAGL